MCATEFQRGPGAQRGVSIVELMVGMVVAMFVGLAAVGSAASFIAAQRQGVGVGAAMISATNALNAIRDDVTAVGLGFFGETNYLCPTLNLGVGTNAVLDGSAFTPLQITAGTNGDQVDVVSGSQLAGGANVMLAAASDGTTAQLRSLLPPPPGSTTLNNQAVLLASFPPSPTVPCTVRTVTASTPADPSGARQTLTFGALGTHNQATFSTTPTYTLGDYSQNRSRVVLLGTLSWNRYRLNGTDLQLDRPMTGATPVVLARNVTAFRAQIGTRSSTAVGALSNWQTVTGAAITPANLALVRALRIGMVTRSAQPEKPDSSGTCRATETAPTLFGAVAVDTSDPTWKCFRYRSVVVVMPVRNVVMGT